MKFGDNLRDLRKSKKISQEKLAEKIGVSRQSVSKWECSEAYPEMNNIFKLCEIFHCKINDLVREDLIDIDSLDEEIKMNIVKFKKEQQRKMKGLSKAIYILARICKVVSILGIFSILITMIIMPIVTSHVKVKNNTIEIFDEKIEYQRSSNQVNIKFMEKENIIKNYNDVYALNVILDKLENNSIMAVVGFIELAFICLGFTLILLYFTFKHLDKLFTNIYDGETPFTMENVKHIKKMAILMIAAIILPNISGVITEMIIGEQLGIGFEMLDLIYILFLFSMSYIFEYGYKIQLDSKGKMYGEEDE